MRLSQSAMQEVELCRRWRRWAVDILNLSILHNEVVVIEWGWLGPKLLLCKGGGEGEE